MAKDILVNFKAKNADLKRKLKEAAEGIDSVKDETEALKQVAKAAGVSTDDLAKRLNSIRSEKRLTGLSQELGLLPSKTENANNKFSAMNAVLGGVGMAAANAAIQIGTQLVERLGEAAVSSVRMAADFEQTKIGITNMVGSAEVAGDVLEDVSRMASRTPFEFPELADSTKQLIAFGFNAEEAVSTVAGLGDVSAAIGAPMGDLAYLMGTLKTQGRAMTIDIRQFAQRGIPIYEYLAKTMGVTTEEVGKLVEEGKVGFPEVEEAFKAMTSEGGQFYNAMEAQSQSFNGLMSTLKDEIGFALREIVGINLRGEIREGSVFAILKEQAFEFVAFLKEDGAEIAKTISNIATGTIDFISFIVDNKEYVAGFAIVIAGLTTQYLIQTGTIGGLITAFTAKTAAMYASAKAAGVLSIKMNLALGVLGAIAVAIWKTVEAYDAMVKSQDQAAENLGSNDAIKALQLQYATVKSLQKAVTSGDKQRIEQELEFLKEMMDAGSITENYYKSIVKSVKDSNVGFLANETTRLKKSVDAFAKSQKSKTEQTEKDTQANKENADSLDKTKKAIEPIEGSLGALEKRLRELQDEQTNFTTIGSEQYHQLGKQISILADKIKKLRDEAKKPIEIVVKTTFLDPIKAFGGKVDARGAENIGMSAVDAVFGQMNTVDNPYKSKIQETSIAMEELEQTGKAAFSGMVDLGGEFLNTMIFTDQSFQDFGQTVIDFGKTMIQTLNKMISKLAVIKTFDFIGGFFGLPKLGSLLGGFASGGYTGDGAKYETAGVVHRGEYVINRDVVAQPGMRQYLESLNNNNTSAGTKTVNANVSIDNFMMKEMFKETLRPGGALQQAFNELGVKVVTI